MNSDPGPPDSVILIGFAICNVGSKILYSTNSGFEEDVMFDSKELFELVECSSISSSSTTEYPLRHGGSGNLNF